MDLILKEYKEKIETFLLQLPYLEEVILYPQIREDIQYIFQMGGKRVRPLLCLSVASVLLGQDESLPLNSACALECFHNFTLVHDDWMDNAPLRRGKPTLHQLRTPSYAILIGDILFAYSCLLITKDPHNHNPEDCLELLTETSLKICEGQVRDLEMYSKDVTLTDYLKMIELKTATLFATSLLIGYLSTGERDKNVFQTLKEFGINMGIFFQLQDDIMDVFPLSADFGKQVGGDIVNRKKTILYFLFYEKASLQDQALMETYWQDPKCPKEKIIHLLEKYQIQDYAYQFAIRYYQKSQDVLNSLPDDYKKLQVFLNILQNRVI